MPAYLDGVATSGLVLSRDNGPLNTNSVIGEFSTAGAALRSYYSTHGGWGTIGWTVNIGGGLNMFAKRSWGRMQDFQHDPDGFGGMNNSVAVPNWDATHARLVDSVFWLAWALGGRGMNGNVHDISVPVADRGACPSGSTPACISFQQSHLGYVWMDSFTGRTAVFCPDMTADRQVDFLDTNYVLARFGTSDPFSDIDGSGGVNLTDALLVNAEFGAACRP